MTHRLPTGQNFSVKNGWFKKTTITYAGMPSDSCYSIVVTWSSSYNSAAYNLFFPTDLTEIEVLGRFFEVKNVTTRGIELTEI